MTDHRRLDPHTARVIARQVFGRGRFVPDDQEPSDYIAQACRYVDRIAAEAEALAPPAPPDDEDERARQEAARCERCAACLGGCLVPEHPEPCTVPPGGRVPPCCGGRPEPRYRWLVSSWRDPVVVERRWVRRTARPS